MSVIASQEKSGGGTSEGPNIDAQLALAMTDLIRLLAPLDRRRQAHFQRRLKRLLRGSDPSLEFYRLILRILM